MFLLAGVIALRDLKIITGADVHVRRKDARGPLGSGKGTTNIERRNDARINLCMNQLQRLIAIPLHGPDHAVAGGVK